MFRFIFLILFVSGCTSSIDIANTPRPLKAGTWEGELAHFSSTEMSDGTKQETIEKVIILTCSPETEIWMEHEGSYSQIYSNYNIEFESGNALLHLIIDGGGWVETQTWGFIQVSDDRALIQRSRMVNNIYFETTTEGADESNDEFRAFGQLGIGALKKTSNSCDVWK